MAHADLGGHEQAPSAAGPPHAMEGGPKREVPSRTRCHPQLMASGVGRNESCPCGSGKKFKRCWLDSSRGTSAPTEPIKETHLTNTELTLLIETADGMMARRIPSASPLTPRLTHGYAAEMATHEAAAIWGLPDFMYRPVIQTAGSGSRELGDGIMIVGSLGIVMQVKSRQSRSSDSARERRWLEKNTTHALSQGAGTIRRLKQHPIELTNLRGSTVEIDGKEHRWLIAVILDHADPPDAVTPSIECAKHPAVVLLRRDWEFLFDQLKSTYAVAHYCERVAGETVELGHEPVRYYDLAQADHETPPEALDPALVVAGHAVVSTPLLPMAPAASDDMAAHRIVRGVFEDIALARFTTASETDRLRILAELDRLPVGQRAEIGSFILKAMDEVRTTSGDGMVWRLKSLRGNAGQAHLGFGACSHSLTRELQDAFGWWVKLRHHDVLAVTEDVEGLTTIGVLVTPRNDTQRPWDTTVSAVSGDLGLTQNDLKTLRQLWPTPPHDPTSTDSS